MARTTWDPFKAPACLIPDFGTWQVWSTNCRTAIIGFETYEDARTFAEFVSSEDPENKYTIKQRGGN